MLAPALFGLLSGVIEVGPTDDLVAVLVALEPGDEVLIHEGTYAIDHPDGFVWAGTELAPIVVRAADGEAVTLTGVLDRDLLVVEGSHYALAGVRLVGGARGLRIGPSVHASFEDLEISDTADVGLSCDAPGAAYEQLVVRRVHVHHTAGTGQCMVLGCEQGECWMYGSLIELDWCHDTVGGTAGDGIELRTGSYGNVIRDNVIHDVGRTGISIQGTVDHRQRNRVEGNVVWNAGEDGIRLVGDADVRNNVVIGAVVAGIHATPADGEEVGALALLHNTVLDAGDSCLQADGLADGDGDVVIANNALYCPGARALHLSGGAGEAILAANAVVGAVLGATDGTFDGIGAEDAFVDPTLRDLYPRVGVPGASPLIDLGDVAHVVDRDFNCLDRLQGTPDVGAYEWRSAENPGWTVEPGFKSCAEPEDGTGGEETGGEETGGEETGGEASGQTASSGSTTTTGGATGGESAGPGEGGADSSTGSSEGGGHEDETGDDAGCGCRAGGRLGPLGPLGMAPWWLRRRRRSAPWRSMG